MINTVYTFLRNISYVTTSDLNVIYCLKCVKVVLEEVLASKNRHQFITIKNSEHFVPEKK